MKSSISMFVRKLSQYIFGNGYIVKRYIFDVRNNSYEIIEERV